jgi:hypothetical protein
MKFRNHTMVLAATLLLASTLQAQSRSEATLQKQGANSIGPIAALNFPSGDLADVTGSIGWGLGVQATHGRGFLTLVGEAGYDGFSGEEYDFEGETFETESTGLWHGALGARATVGPVYVGGLAGYWGGDGIEDFDIVPMVGLHLWKIDVGARYKGLFGDADWFAVTGAIHFGKW